MDESDGQSGVETTEASLTLLEEIRREGGATSKKLAEKTDMSKSTIHRHLITLEQNGYVQRYGSIFQLGLKFLDMSESVRCQWPRDAINDVVSTLGERTDEEIDFFTVDRGRLISLESRHRKYHQILNRDVNVQSGNHHTSYYRMHTMGAGKAILAEYPDSRVRRIIDAWGLPANTDQTITSEAELFDELAAIRDRGYAVDDEEYARGLRTVGKVVQNPNGGVFGALNVAGPRYRMEGIILSEEIPSALESAAEELEAKIANEGVIVRDQPLTVTNSFH